jgi:hypothetical protein
MLTIPLFVAYQVCGFGGFVVVHHRQDERRERKWKESSSSLVTKVNFIPVKVVMAIMVAWKRFLSTQLSRPNPARVR